MTLLRSPTTLAAVFFFLPLACSGASEDDSSEDAVQTCTAPNAGPLKPASHWVRPGGFVNVEVEGASADLRVEKMSKAVGGATARKMGLGAQISYVVEFEPAAKGFFRIVASRAGQDVGEVRVRVSSDVPRIQLGAIDAKGKVDPVALLQ